MAAAAEPAKRAIVDARDDLRERLARVRRRRDETRSALGIGIVAREHAIARDRVGR